MDPNQLPPAPTPPQPGVPQVPPQAPMPQHPQAGFQPHPGTAQPQTYGSTPVQPIMPPAASPLGPNPYEFITAPGAKAKKPGLSVGFGGNSVIKRLLIVFSAIVLALILFSIGSAIVKSRSQGNTPNLQAVLADQQEIIRVSAFGTTSAQSATALNLATTASQSVYSEQIQLKQYLGSKKVKTTPLQLNAKKDKSTDTALESAKQTNTFDAVFTEAMIELLNTYTTDLTKAYNGASNQASKDILKTSFDSASLLVKGFAPTPSP